MRRVALIAGVIVAIAIATFGLLHAPLVRTWALAEIASRLERTGLVVGAGRLDYNLATLTVHLHDVTIATAAAPSLPFFSAAEIHATFGWGALSGRQDAAFYGGRDAHHHPGASCFGLPALPGSATIGS